MSDDQCSDSKGCGDKKCSGSFCDAAEGCCKGEENSADCCKKIKNCWEPHPPGKD